MKAVWSFETSFTDQTTRCHAPENNKHYLEKLKFHTSKTHPVKYHTDHARWETRIYGRIILKSTVNKQGVRAMTAFVKPLLRRWWTFHLSQLRFYQKWWIESSGILCVDWEIIPDVSKRSNPFIFRIKVSGLLYPEDEGIMLLRNVAVHQFTRR